MLMNRTFHDTNVSNIRKNVVSRNGAIEFWRMIFCLLIVVYHEIHATMGFFTGGAIGVEFFFLVSGFLMAKSVAKTNENPSWNEVGQETARFLWRKIKPIYPGFLIATFLGLIIVNIVRETSLFQIAKEAVFSIWNLFFVSLPEMKSFLYMGHTWYLSAMFFAMLILYPLLRKNRKLFLYVIAPVLVIYLGFVSTASSYQRAINVLVLGCICYAVNEKLKQITFRPLGRWLISLIEYGGYSFVVFTSFFKTGASWRNIWIFILAVCVTLTFSHKGAVAGWFDKPVFLWLGKFSLYLYLNHYACLQFRHYITNLPTASKFILIMLFSIALSLLAMLIEYFLRKLMPKIKALIIIT